MDTQDKMEKTEKYFRNIVVILSVASMALAVWYALPAFRNDKTNTQGNVSVDVRQSAKNEATKAQSNAMEVSFAGGISCSG